MKDFLENKDIIIDNLLEISDEERKIIEYVEFIERNYVENRKNNTELHHILPKCVFKKYKNLKHYKWNGVHLRISDHVKAHVLLSDISPLFVFPWTRVSDGELTYEEIERMKVNNKKTIPAIEIETSKRVRVPREIYFNNRDKYKYVSDRSGEKNSMFENGYRISGKKNGRHRDNFKGDLEKIGKKISNTYQNKTTEEKLRIKEKELETKRKRGSDKIGAKKMKETKKNWSEEKREEIKKKYSKMQKDINDDPKRREQKRLRLLNTMEKKKEESFYLYELFSDCGEVVSSFLVHQKKDIKKILRQNKIPLKFLSFLDEPLVVINEYSRSSDISRAKKNGSILFENYILTVKKMERIRF